LYFWVQNITQNRSGRKRKETVADNTQIDAATVEEIWIKTSFLIVSRSRVLGLFRGHYDKYLKLLKPFKQRQVQDKFKKMLNLSKRRNIPDCLILLPEN
jgi:hypothetical protein